MSKVRLNVTIDIQGGEFSSFNSRSVDVEKLDLDSLLQTFCEAIPKHDFPKTDKLAVLQFFDRDGKVVGHCDV